MEEKRGKNGHAQCQGRAEVGIVQSRKWVVFGFLAFMISVGVAWAGERGVQLVVGRDSTLCARVLEVFREDVDDRGQLRYQHEAFRKIIWTPVELKGQGPRTRHCSSLDKAILDLDSNGQQDLVVKTTFCMKGAPSDSFYVFPADSPILDQASWADMSSLLSTSDKFERTGGAYPLTSLPMQNVPPPLTTRFTIQLFMLDSVAYVSLTDARREWIVITQYLRGERFEDLCYLRAGQF
jgi:hypothetical protein